VFANVAEISRFLGFYAGLDVEIVHVDRFAEKRKHRFANEAALPVIKEYQHTRWTFLRLLWEDIYGCVHENFFCIGKGSFMNDLGS
jgi:hypothetical protein